MEINTKNLFFFKQKGMLAIIFLILLQYKNIDAQPVFKNPGISAFESFEMYDHIDTVDKYVVAKASITLKERNGLKYYYIIVNEGSFYTNEIEVNFNDLTTISEKRTDLTDNSVEEYFTHYNNLVHFYNKINHIKKNVQTSEKNIYSRYAYFLSFRGFPFESEKSVSFKSYMYEYGDALTMKVTNLGKQTVLVKAGNFECYKLELAVGSWQSFFASDKVYLYFTMAKPHYFVKYEEKDEKGHWNTNELIRMGN